MANFNNRGFER